MKVYSQKWVAATLAMVIAGTNVAPVLAKGTIATTNNKTTMSQNAPKATTGNHNSKFPNDTFRKAILMQVLGKSAQEATVDYVITNADFAAIQAFTAPTSGVLMLRSLTGPDMLTGLEHMTALTGLSLIDSQVTTLDLSTNVNLTELEVTCSVAQVGKLPLSSLDLSQNTKLTNLRLNSNSLTTLDLSKNTALTTVEIQNTPIAALDFSKNLALTKLAVTYNPSLATLNVSKNTGLTRLATSRNALKTLDLTANTALTHHDDGTDETVRQQLPTMTKDAEADGSFAVKLEDIVGQGNLDKVSGTVSATEGGVVDNATKIITWTADKKNTKPTIEYTYDASGPAGLTTKNNIKVKMTVNLKGPIVTHAVTIDSRITGGTVTTDKATASDGETVTLTVTPDAGKQLKSRTLKYHAQDGSTEGVITTQITGQANKYTFNMVDTPVEIVAEFENIPTVTVPTNLVGGAITTDKTTAPAGETVILTVTPEAGYQLKAGTLNYTKDNVDTAITTVVDATLGTYSFEMPAGNVTIKAEFEPLSYPVTVGTMTNGTVEVTSPTPTVQWGTVVQVTVKPEVGYVLTKNSLKAGTVAMTPAKGGTWADFEFTMPKEAVALNASFEVSPQFPIVVEKPKLPAGETPKGDVSLSNPTAKAGETVQLTVAPVAGYQLKADTLIVNGKVLNPSAAALAKMRTVEEFAPMVQTPVMGRAPQAFSFIMPPSEVSISAEFEVIPATAPPVTPPTPDTAPPVAPPVVVPTTPNNPNTGDIGGVAGFMAMAMVSATGLIGLKKRKAKN